MPLLSVVSPVYRAAGCLPELHRRLTQVLGQLTPDYEIVLVDDGSDDRSWEVVVEIAGRDRHVKGIRLSRNFGQHYAIAAGLDHARGQWVVVMDCDLQDQPEEIPALYRKALEGYDVVFARRLDRRDKWLTKTRSQLFSLVYNLLGDIRLDNSVANFSIASAAAAAGVRRFRERNRSYPIFLSWVGFRRAFVDVAHSERFEGKSSYTWSKLFDFAVDSIVSQSNKPLRLSIRFGFLLALVSFIVGAVLVVRYFAFRIPVAGWTSVIVSIWFIGGLMFANLGVLGLYLGKVFDEVKRRPLYLVQTSVNLDEGPCAPVGGPGTSSAD